MSPDDASAPAPSEIELEGPRLIAPIARELHRLPTSSLDCGRVEDVDVDLLISSLGGVKAALHSGSREQLAGLGARLVRAAACAVTACGPDAGADLIPEAAISAVLNSVAARTIRRRRHRAAGLPTSGTLDAFDLDGLAELPVDLREAAEANTRTDLLAYSGAILCEYAAVIADDLDQAGLAVETLLAARAAVEDVAEFMGLFPLHRWLVDEDGGADPGWLFHHLATWVLSSTLRGEPICPDGVDTDFWRWTRVALAADALARTLHADILIGSSKHSAILATATSRLASAAALGERGVRDVSDAESEIVRGAIELAAQWISIAFDDCMHRRREVGTEWEVDALQEMQVIAIVVAARHGRSQGLRA